MIPAVSIARPLTVADALVAIDDDTSPFCGGTELLLAMRMGLLSPSRLLDLKAVEELRVLYAANGVIHVGAARTHAELAFSALIRDQLPLLARVEAAVGNPRVRAQGTIGGNLCFAEPKSDVVAVLIALNASVFLQSADGTRIVSVSEFIVGAYDTDLQMGEIMIEVQIPVNRRDGAHLKYQVMERPTVSVVVAPTDEGLRVVIGAAGETPVWQDAPDSSHVDVDDMIGRLDPLEDLSGSGDYKRHVARVFVDRALARFDGEAAR